MSEAHPQNLANTRKAFTGWAREAEQQLREFNPQTLATTSGVFATGKQPHEEVLMALVKAAVRCINEFIVQNEPE